MPDRERQFANNAMNHLIVITGGPGSGKSTLIDALEGLGFRRSLEAGRAIIQTQRHIGGSALPWADRQLFAEMMLSWEMRSHQELAGHDGPVFFDRGVPDVIGYLGVCGLPVPPHMEAAARSFRYRRQVFIAPPWPEIFGGDAERRQSLGEAERTHDAMIEAYSRHGYELVPLPMTSVEERVAFVLDRSGLTRPDR
jgi:predicted ATPase